MQISENDQEIYELAKSLRSRGHAETLRELKEKGRYSDSSPGSKIIKTVSRTFRANLKEFVTKFESRKHQGGESRSTRLRRQILEIGFNACVGLTVQHTVNFVGAGPTGKNAMSRLEGTIGADLAKHHWYEQHRRANPSGWGKLANRIKKATENKKSINIEQMLTNLRNDEECDPDAYFEEMSLEDRRIVSKFLVEMLFKCCPTVFKKRIRTYYTAKGRPAKEVTPIFTEEMQEKMLEMEAMYGEVTPLKLPITDPPLDWSNPYDGGYWNNQMFKQPMMSTRNREQLDSLAESTCPELYKSVNTLQRVRWELNEHVLEVYREAADAEWKIGNVELPRVSREEDFPERPDTDDKSSKEWKGYARAVDLFYTNAKRWDAERPRVARSIFLGDFYKGRPFYLVHGIDFRGRIYPSSSCLNYQSEDLTRASLRFADAKPITTKEQADWFYIHGANCWGYDKATFAERVQWVEDHKEAIARVAEDPISERFWTEADKPWLFLAWCMEAGQFFEEGLGFMSKLPCSMDGSNNGLQIYSLMLRDSKGGESTNCVPTDRPSDIYQDVADGVTKRLKEIVSGEDANASSEDRAFARGFLDLCDGNFPRKGTKRIVMTYVYGSSPYSRQAYVAEWYYDIVRGKNIHPGPFPYRSTFKAFNWMASLISEELEFAVMAAKEAMKWMQDVSRICTENDVHVKWTTPTGLQVVQAYDKMETRVITVNVIHRIRVPVREPNGGIDPRKSANALCPNFVHSLDGAAAALTVNRASEEGVTHFMMIHDSFGTHAADCPTLARVLREVYVDIFKENPLEQLRDAIQDLLPDVELPELPAQGTLDIQQLHQAKYFFA